MDNRKSPSGTNLHPFPTRTPPAGPAPEAPPEGKTELVCTYLEMYAPPAPWRGGRRNEATAIMRAQQCTVSFYRYLYDTVGEAWKWFDRRSIPDAELRDIIAHDSIEIYVLYVAGTPAGYGELDRRRHDEIELAYFGLLPDFLGRGLGPYLLHWLQDKAWSYRPRRLWVHTCNLDHPGAMACYQRAGFSAYRQERLIIDMPNSPE